MNLDLDDGLGELRHAISRLASDHRSADGGLDKSSDFWRSFVESGWPALALPEDRGGADGSLAACGVVLEEVARNGFVTPFLSSLVVSGAFLARALPPGERQDLFDAMVGGDTKVAFAIDPPNYPPPQIPCLMATQQSGAWHFAGITEYVTGGGAATHFIIAGRCPDGEYLVAIVPSDQPGLSIRRYPTWRGEDAADLTFDCSVPEANVIACAPRVPALVSDAFRRAHVAICWEALGMIKALLDDTIEHVCTRLQFGAPMANLQVVRHRIAEMSVYLRESQMIVRGATILAESAQAERVALAARARVAEAARYVGRQAIQLHGAMGTTQESRIAALFRKLTAFEHLYGSTPAALSRYADTMIGTEAARASAILP